MTEPIGVGRDGPGLSRRALLRFLAWTGLAGAAGWLSTHAASEAMRPLADPFDFVFQLLPCRDSACAVGARYLRETPDEADPAVLVALLGLPDPLGGLAAPIDVAALRAALSALHREDFRCGRVFELDGWTLSRSELRLAALAVLASQPAGRSDLATQLPG